MVVIRGWVFFIGEAPLYRPGVSLLSRPGLPSSLGPQRVCSIAAFTLSAFLLPPRKPDSRQTPENYNLFTLLQASPGRPLQTRREYTEAMLVSILQIL